MLLMLWIAENCMKRLVPYYDLPFERWETFLKRKSILTLQTIRLCMRSRFWSLNSWNIANTAQTHIQLINQSYRYQALTGKTFCNVSDISIKIIFDAKKLFWGTKSLVSMLACQEFSIDTFQPPALFKDYTSFIK